MKHCFKTSLPLCVVALAFAGCGESSHVAGGGGHHHESAHGGVAVELGEHQFHLDFLHDPKAGSLSAWVMDAHAENFVRVPLKSLSLSIVAGGQTNALTLDAVASVSTGETVGDTSQFKGEAAWLKGVTAFQAVIPEVEIRGSKFTAVSFAYPKDDHAGHKH